MNIIGQCNGFIVAQICNEVILSIFLHKAEAISSIFVFKAGDFIHIGLIAIFINDHVCIFSNATVFRSSKIQDQVAIVINHVEVTATKECGIVNARHAVGELNACQATATLERTISNARELTVVSKINTRQATATGERRDTDAR